MVSAPSAAAKVSWPEPKALRPKPACSISGSRNGRAPMPDPEQEAADDRGAEGRHAQQAEVEHRVGDPAGVADVEQDADGARPPAAPALAQPGTMSRPMVSKPNISPTRPDGGQHEARRRRSGGGRGSRSVRDEQGDQDQAQDRDRDVDPEDPAPVEVGGDEAAEQRPDHRPDQRRHGEPGHGASPARPWPPSAAGPGARPAPSSPRPGPAACAPPPAASSESLSPHRIEPPQEHHDGAAEHVLAPR